MLTEWINKGWEDFKRKWTTYIGIEVLTIVVVLLFLGLAILLGISLAATSGLEMALLSTFTAAPIVLAIVLLVVAYMYAALMKTYTLDKGVIDIIKETANIYLPFLGALIVTALAYWLPIKIFLLIGKAIGQEIILTVLGFLVGLYLYIRLVTLVGRVVHGQGLIESIEKSWNTDSIDSAKVLLVLLVFSITSMILSFIPVIGILIDFLVVLPTAVATYMAAVETFLK